MASYENRNGRVRAVIQHPELKPKLQKTFVSKALAKGWAENIEALLQQGLYFDDRDSRKTKFTDLLQRYADEITEYKPKTTRKAELSKVRVLKLKLAGKSLNDIHKRCISDYIRNRMLVDNMCWDTVAVELNLIGAVLKVARIGWDMVLHEHAIRDGIVLFDILYKSIPRRSNHRDRRVEPDEYDLIVGDGGKHALIALFAVETAMRRGELAKVRVNDVDRDIRILYIRESKSDKTQRQAGREVPLSIRALKIFETFAGDGDKNRLLFGYDDPDRLTEGWKTLAKKLGIIGLRFHDFRHEGTSRLFERGWQIPQVALVTGHGRWDSLRRYTNLRASSLVKTLD